ncbi:Akirin-1 [Saguinus oedipus]|uniref:Akirin-1 n=1 Tax=Saguinus oedipus TaxID=9490 RepID=A0ABQ9VAV6_SAGOE|nr:Akirin-1 [Saguinus oedipus]
MACGATLKRPMEFEAALLSPGSPKRRRCAPLPGPTPGLRPPDAEPPPPFQTQTPPPSLQQPAPPGSERRLPTPEGEPGGVDTKRKMGIPLAAQGLPYR